MSKETTNENLDKKPERSAAEKELLRIKEGLNYASGKIIENLRQRVGTGDWKLFAMDLSLDNGKESIDMVFSAPDGKKEKFIIIDLSIPHLGIGQKYALPGKAKLLQSEREVTAARIKKAIILIRKGTESVSTQATKIRCPIIEIQLESIVKPERAPAPARESQTTSKPQAEKSVQNSTARASNQPEKDRSVSSTGISGVSPELLTALKEAIVHECLSTMHKRCNKYIRKGIWRWIEREIMDPNVHFYLIILSSIYQGKTGEILSRRFRTAESYSSSPEEVINALFSKENNLADEIKKNAERHKKALNKFLACFSQTLPFEYLKSIFLKDFRSHADGLKARMTVYSTLMQLLERCGFEGEKETQYPLEILDELKVFQGIMTGNYAVLRTDNASKKLKHLVPQVEWTNEDIYQLRNQLAKALNLPAQEFNLNAFLPQAFMHDAKYMAETRKEAIRGPVTAPVSTNAQSERPQRDNVPASRPDNRGGRNQRPQVEKPSESDQPDRYPERQPQQRDKRHPGDDNRNLNAEIPPRKSRYPQAVEVTESRADDENVERPINVENLLESRNNDAELIDHNRKRPGEIDEARHRFFEYFGGITEEDQDSVRLALAIDRYEAEAVLRAASKSAQAPVADDSEIEDTFKMPVKRAAGSPMVPVNSMPPRRPSNNGSNGASNGTGNPNNRGGDRKRRFNKNSPRNKTRRMPSNPGVNR